MIKTAEDLLNESLCEYNSRSQVMCEYAKRYNLDILEPRTNELYIDIDNEGQYKAFQAQLEWLGDFLPGVEITRNTPSMSGLPKRHIVLQLPNGAPLIERCALQLVLGGDPLHARLCLMRALIGDEYPIVFFEKKEEEENE